MYGQIGIRKVSRLHSVGGKFIGIGKMYAVAVGIGGSNAVEPERNALQGIQVAVAKTYGNASRGSSDRSGGGADGKQGNAQECNRQHCKKSFIVRTAWLYGDGHNFVKTMLRLAETRDDVGVVADQVGSPTSALELAKGIAALVETDNYGVFHGTCEGQCSWADFAEKIFEKAGKSTTVKRLTTEEYPTPTKRPAYSVLENRMFKLTTNHMFAQWEDALDVYMKDLLG